MHAVTPGSNKLRLEDALNPSAPSSETWAFLKRSLWPGMNAQSNVNKVVVTCCSIELNYHGNFDAGTRYTR